MPESDFLLEAVAVSPEATATELTANFDKFQSVAELHDFLSRLLLLLAQDKISPRRAAVLAYITNQRLRTINDMQSQADAALKKQPVQIIIDVHRPGYPVYDDRTGSDSPSLQPVRKTVSDLYVASACQEGVAHAGKEGIKP